MDDLKQLLEFAQLNGLKSVSYNGTRLEFFTPHPSSKSRPHQNDPQTINNVSVPASVDDSELFEMPSDEEMILAATDFVRVEE